MQHVNHGYHDGMPFSQHQYKVDIPSDQDVRVALEFDERAIREWTCHKSTTTDLKVLAAMAAVIRNCHSVTYIEVFAGKLDGFVYEGARIQFSGHINWVEPALVIEKPPILVDTGKPPLQVVVSDIVVDTNDDDQSGRYTPKRHGWQH